ncbi:MAG: serpin family protein [Verrucomicrobiaceae bacterium]|nr:MAG: serpin family protein [Verrucomicrobiaceae bacterium]
MKTTMLHTLLGAATLATAATAETSAVARGINAFGLDLHRVLAEDGGNRLASPWSIQSALAMTYAGAAGKTKEEMAKVLHFTADETALHAGFQAIAADLSEQARGSREQLDAPGRSGGPNTPLEINAANRLFGQDGYPFEKPFLEFIEKSYGAPLEKMDFTKQAEACRGRINQWVEEQTKDRIKDLIPPGLLDEETRLVLTNAIYMKAPWAAEFVEDAEAPFFVNGVKEVKLPGLVKRESFGYRKIPGGALVSVPYAGGGLQFLLMIPDEKDGLAALEKTLTAGVLTEAAALPPQDIRLHFPKFKLEPESILLAENLTAMGMPSAFNKPRGSADFSRMAPRKPDDYLCISEVVHKAFIAVDKHGTEAAAATAVIMARATSMPVEPAEPLEIRVDRPFAFAIQHVSSGACLFLGRVTDPR